MSESIKTQEVTQINTVASDLGISQAFVEHVSVLSERGYVFPVVQSPEELDEICKQHGVGLDSSIMFNEKEGKRVAISPEGRCSIITMTLG